MGELIREDNGSLIRRVENLAYKYSQVSQVRDPRLFTVFLVEGHKITTLGSVPINFFDEVIYAKVCLGMLITLYDDLADNPICLNPTILQELYRLNIGVCPRRNFTFNKQEERIYELASVLFIELENTLRSFPHFIYLLDILIFDIKQIYFANQYAELMTLRPEIRNLRESQAHGPYNMGMVASGMIDLMASPHFQFSELGKIREIFIQGQRTGRIGNLINTFERELAEGDVTNEMMIHPDGVVVSKRLLLDEMTKGLEDLCALNGQIRSLSISNYAQGLRDLFQLHTLMKGTI